MVWYDMEEGERIKSVYSKETIDSFWDWWAGKGSPWMELRTLDWRVAKQIAHACHIRFYSHTGVFINNHLLLKKVISYTRVRGIPIWFGVNPRKFGIGRWGNKTLSGGDNFVQAVKFVFIDLDRKIKDGPATADELRQCDMASDIILERLSKSKWANSYLKICSGHGVQLMIKLDVPLEMPPVEYEKIDEGKGKSVCVYKTNSLFNVAKNMVTTAIGRPMKRYIEGVAADLNIEVDSAGFRISQVGALPWTKNIKYKTTRWRGIIELKKGINDGLADYILSREDNIEKFVKNNIFKKPSGMLDVVHRIRPGELEKNVLVQFMFQKDLPRGNRTQRLWYSLKLLVRDNKLQKSPEFGKVHRKLEVLWKKKLTPNFPGKDHVFNERVVNNFCINNNVPPLYPFMFGAKAKFLCDNVDMNWERDCEDDLPKATSTFEDMRACRDKMKSNDYTNVKIMGKFISKFKRKYGEEKTKYFVTYIFKKYFSSV